jgi:hypothetical protein
MNFGEWIRYTLTKHKKSMAWMATEIQASQSLLTRWRQGSIPRTEYFLRVCIVIARLEKKPLQDIVVQGSKTMGIIIHVD